MSSAEPTPPLEFRWKGREGEPDRWSWAVAAPELDKNGNIIAVTGTIMDISAAKAAEHFQEKRATEAIELREASERFVDMTSHEVRNPLSAAILSSDASIERTQQLLKHIHGSDVEPRLKSELYDMLEDLKIISLCCSHINRLVDDILTLSKIGQSAAAPDRQTFIDADAGMSYGRSKLLDMHAHPDTACALRSGDARHVQERAQEQGYHL